MPPSEVLRKMGDKVTARRTMASAGIPVIPGSMNAVKDEDEVAGVAERDWLLFRNEELKGRLRGRWREGEP